MLSQPYHTMNLEYVHPSGDEEWACPTCGRRILMNWPPAYKKTVLEAGDEEAIHTGGKSPVGLTLNMAGAQINEPTSDAGSNIDTRPTVPDTGTTPLSDDMRRWLGDAGFEQWWQA